MMFFKRKVMICFYIVSLSFSVWAQTQAYRTRTILLKKGNSGAVSLKTVEKYDPEGRMTESASYNADNTLLEKNIYQYDKKGQKINERRFDCYGVICYSENYIYNDSGNIKEQQKDLGGIPVNRVLYIYNTEKRPIKKVEFRSNIVGSNVINYSYDKAGKLTIEKKVDCRGDMCYLIDHVYNNDKKQSEEYIYNSDNILLEKKQIRYNDKSRIASESKISPQGKLLERMDYTYNSQGKILTEKKINPVMGMVLTSTVNSYIADRLANTKVMNRDNRVIQSIDYQYDIFGRIKSRETYLFNYNSQGTARQLFELLEYSYE